MYKFNNLKLTIGLISAALFSYELILTRYFSAVLPYSLVYVVVSMALFGIGMGGYIAYTKNRLKSEDQIIEGLITDMTKLMVFIVVFFVIAIFVPYIPSIVAYILLAGLPYIYGGKIISMIYKINGNDSHKLYFFDMAGAALGCVSVIWFMNTIGFYGGIAWVFLLISLCLFTLLRYSKGKKLLVAGIFIFILSIILVIPQMNSTLNKYFIAYKTNPNKSIAYLNNTYDGNAEILYSEWNAFSRTDVVKYADDSERMILTDGGAAAPMIRFDGNLESVAYLKSDIGYLPHLISKNEKSLLIGTGGGKDVLYALLGQSKTITAVEINESTVRSVEMYKEYNGNIYGEDKVTLIVGDGRKYVDQSEEQFDHIYMSMLMSNAIDNSMMSLVENYIFTEEAFESYYNAIEDDGRISFMVHNGNEALRVANTWISTLLKKGIKLEDTTEYFVIVNGVSNHGDTMSIHMPMVILKKNTFKDNELNTITTFLNENNISALHFPGQANIYYRGIAENQMTIEEMMNQMTVKLTPVTDNNPYFYKYSTVIPKELLPLLVILIVLISYFHIKLKNEKIDKYHSVYFTLTGMAYILIEVGLIQVIQRYVEKPVYSFSIVITGLLIGSAVGALLSKRLVKVLGKNIYMVTGVILLCSTLGMQGFISFMIRTMEWELVTKIAILIPSIFILGIAMGIFFPIGIERLYEDKKTRKYIPIMYAISGIASVMGSMIAVAVAVNKGFSSVVVVGGLIYLLLGIKMFYYERAL